MNDHLKHIRRAAAGGLWGSVGAVILAALFVLASPWRFYPNAFTARTMLVVSTVLAVLVVSSTLLTIRRHIPQLRQTEALEEKLCCYESHIGGIYWSTLAAVVIIAVLAVLSAQSALLMLAMVATLVLILAYPNIYRIKVDQGLTDEEMQSLFGDRYIAENKDDK